MNTVDPRRDTAALNRRNRTLVLALAVIAALFYLGIQMRWGWLR